MISKIAIGGVASWRRTFANAPTLVVTAAQLAPLVGLADAIVDLVSTGNTLKANKLVEVEEIMQISSRLVVNQAALKLKQAPLRRLIDAFAKATAARAA